MKRIRVDVFDGDKKIANFEGNIDMDSFIRTEGRVEEEESLVDQFIDFLRDTKITGNGLKAASLSEIADQWYQKKFDEIAKETTFKHDSPNLYKTIRKAMFGE